MPRGEAYKRSYQKHLANQKQKKDLALLLKDNPQEILKKLAKYGTPKLLNSYLKASKITLKDFANLKDNDGNNILHLAILNGNNKLIEHLTKSQTILNLPNNMKETPLHLAAIIANAEAFAQLIKAKSKQDAVDKDGLTPIQRAMGLKDEYIDRFLNIPGIDLNIRNQKNETALHRAIDIQDFSGANKLIAKGVAINAQDNEGKTALHLLVVKEYPPEGLNIQIEKMIHSGADLFLPDYEGNTAFTDAIKFGKIETVEKLINIVQTKKELSNDEKIAIIKEARKSRHDYDIPKIADALGVNLEQQKAIESRKSAEIPDQNALHSARDDSQSVDALHSALKKSREENTSLSVTKLNEKESSFKTKQDTFLKKLEDEYGKGILTPSFLAKVTEYVTNAKLTTDSKLTHDDGKYKDYQIGQARKGKSHKFAELISGMRNTDNQMIQEITNQFHKFATEENHKVALPKRYVKIQSTHTK